MSPGGEILFPPRIMCYIRRKSQWSIDKEKRKALFNKSLNIDDNCVFSMSFAQSRSLAKCSVVTVRHSAGVNKCAVSPAQCNGEKNGIKR